MGETEETEETQGEHAFNNTCIQQVMFENEFR